MRRRAAAVLACVLLAGCSAPGASTAPGETTPLPAPAGSSPAPDAGTPTTTPEARPCTAEASALGLREQVGQLIMIGVTVDLGARTRSTISGYHVGSAIVMGATPGGSAQVASLTKKLRDLGGTTGMLVAADQEGGLVQRLKGPGFGTIPSAARQARLSYPDLEEKATGWATAMAKAGVLLNLAPVADVVPAANRTSNQPIARLGRGYGSDPTEVSAKVDAFRSGMAIGGVAVAVKHFPGLGAVVGNTDFAARVVDRTTTARSKRLKPFQDAIGNGAQAVMVSSAYYTRIDAKRPAMFSPTVIGLLRHGKFEGVVISDDLGAAAALSAVPESQRALRFVRAGGDLALTVDPATAGAMADGLYDAAKSDPDLAQRVTESAARVLALKAGLGQFTCG